MRLFYAILSVAMISVSVAGGAFFPQQSNDPYTSIPRISILELKQLIEEGRVVIVDVRGVEAYDDGHLRGAISIPLEEVVARAKELPQDKMIVTYCA